MNTKLEALIQQRQTALHDLQTIDRLRRGTLSEQFFPSRSGATAKRGPYYVLQGYFQGQKFAQRIPKEQAPQVQADVDNYRRFQTLAETYVTLTDQITRLQDGSADSKKNSSRRRSPPRSSRKPTPS